MRAVLSASPGITDVALSRDIYVSSMQERRRGDTHAKLRAAGRITGDRTRS
jgi:hypothetical protein